MKSQELDAYIDRLQSAFHATMRKLGPKLAESSGADLTGPQFFILHLLSQKDRYTVTELAAEMTVKPSAITAMTDRLHKHGFVTRDRDETDRRVVFIRITDKGSKALRDAKAKRKQLIVSYLSRLQPDELKSLVVIYEKMARIVAEEDGNNLPKKNQ